MQLKKNIVLNTEQVIESVGDEYESRDSKADYTKASIL